MVKSTNTTDTIVAQATAPGRGGIAIVRVSGPLVLSVITSVLGSDLKPREATHRLFKNQQDEIIDDGIAIYFPNPNSFTGEDVLELHGHGGPLIVDMLIQTILKLGPRLARPGEFSERAFLNGKIDLAQAEAIADLIDASSSQAARLALRSLQGDFSQTIRALTEKIIQLRIFIEAGIDFSEEEIDFLSDKKIRGRFSEINDQLVSIQASAKQGSFLREGITVVIAGEPNVGKSSLLNALSGKDLAIVTNIPGTTRDVLRDYILIDGIPLHIIDTAGLRASTDVVELEGIKRAHQEIEKADLVLYVKDACRVQPSKPQFGSNPIIYIHNKIDITEEMPFIREESGCSVIGLSAKTGIGIDLLKKHIKSIIGVNDNSEGIFLARRRHLDALARAYAHIETGLALISTKQGELVAEELRLAQLALSEITGEFTTEDLLGRIFASFCIGK